MSTHERKQSERTRSLLSNYYFLSPTIHMLDLVPCNTNCFWQFTNSVWILHCVWLYIKESHKNHTANIINISILVKNTYSNTLKILFKKIANHNAVFKLIVSLVPIMYFCRNSIQHVTKLTFVGRWQQKWKNCSEDYCYTVFVRAILDNHVAYIPRITHI